MNNSGISVNSELMSQIGGEVNSAAGEYNNYVASLRSNINELLTIWTSDPTGSAAAFRTAYETYDKVLDNFGKILSDVGNAAIQSANDFEAGESERTSAAKNLY